MIVYEVNLHIDAIAADEYAEWLGPHIEQILEIEGFQKADWFAVSYTHQTLPTNREV